MEELIFIYLMFWVLYYWLSQYLIELNHNIQKTKEKKVDLPYLVKLILKVLIIILWLPITIFNNI